MDKRALALKTLEVASGFIGTTRANNPAQVGRFLSLFDLPYAENGVPLSFCAAGLSYAMCKAYAYLQTPMLPTDLTSLKHIKSIINQNVFSLSPLVWRIRDDAKRRGMVRPASYIPRPGDLVWYNWFNDSTADNNNHIGIVRGFVPNHQQPLKTVEFNTSSGLPGSQGNGGGVWARERSLFDVMGYILLG